MQIVGFYTLFLNFFLNSGQYVQKEIKISCPGILLTGGEDNSVPLIKNEIFMYYPQKSDKIERLDINLTTERSSHESVLFNGDVIVAMGFGAGTTHQWRAVDLVNLHSGMVTPGVSLPYAVEYGSMAVLNNKVWLCGGEEEGHTNRMSRKCTTFNGKCWKQAAPLQVARGDAAMVELNGHLYMIGGLLQIYPLTVTDIVEKYSPITQTWKYVASVNQKRYDAGATTLNGKIYLCGGEADVDYNSCEYYVPEKDAWFTDMMHMNRKRTMGFPLVLYQGNMYALGGDPLSIEKTIEYYDAKSNTWQMVSGRKMPYRRQAAVAVLKC